MNKAVSPDTSFLTCESCGAWNDAAAEVCRECREPVRDDAGYDTSFHLSFAAETCPSCGRVSPAGACVSCGADVSATSEVSEAARARERALRPLLEQAETLLSRFDKLPDPHIGVSADQYAATLADGRLFKRLRVLMRFPRTLGQ
ncbi:MAG: Double zinc ribbon, partial [Gaiellaceae bacterium]|nr:Double zinc ribbon [Gaiellaceae bacterium]